MRRFTYLLVVHAITGGCNSNSSTSPSVKSAHSTPVPTVSAEVPGSEVDAEETAFVEKSGGKLKRNTSGSITEIDLRDCKLNNEQLTSLLRNLGQLRALRLSGKNGATVVDDGAMDAVANCRQLRALALDDLWVSEQGLAKLSGLSSLSELYLANSLVDDAAAGELVKFSQLKKLRLAHTQLTDVGLAKLVAIKPLEDLDLSECVQLTDDGLRSVGEMQGMKKLNLWRVPISDAGVEHLAKLSNLEWLNLDNTKLTDAGLVHLSEMKKLEFLHLGSTSVSDSGMDQLKSLSGLKDLKVTRTAVTEAGVAALQSALPNVAIQLKYRESE